MVSLTETCNCTALVSERRAERGSVSFIFIATVLWLVSFSAPCFLFSMGSGEWLKNDFLKSSVIMNALAI